MLMLVGMMGMLAVGAVAFMGMDDEDEALARGSAEGEAGNGADAAGGGMTDVGALLDGGPEMPAAGTDQTADGPAAGPDQGDDTQGAVGGGDIDATDDAGQDADPEASVDWGITTGGDDDDTLTGTGGNDFLVAYGGDDMASGGEGTDQIEGGEGDDSLFGEAGDDTLHGQEGDDLAEGGSGDDDLYGHGGDDTLLGGEGDDSLAGGMGDDMADGGAGDDAVHGYYGNDTLTGGDGADTLFGGYGDDLVNGLGPDGEDDGMTDYLNGGDGADNIIAGAGDVVTGGAGADTMLLGGDTGTGPVIEIMDFVSEEDSLLIEYDHNGEMPEVDLVRDEDQEGLFRVLLDGAEVALVHSAGGMGLDDIALVPRGVI